VNYVKKNIQDHFKLLRKISKKPEASQRRLAEELGFSLGKLNYCINELHNKGLIKIKNFNKNKKKSSYLYLLTPQGISSKTKLTLNFMKKKLNEYDELKAEISNEDMSDFKKQSTKKIDHNLL
jgi:EPS-associated MarR family transcriptional regulator|tara:strand:- start:892 stop:1260 length:369 start_codon:yes stop_codon:yes gene_type:complete